MKYTETQKKEILHKVFNSDFTDYLLKRNKFIVDEKLTKTGEELFKMVQDKRSEKELKKLL